MMADAGLSDEGKVSGALNSRYRGIKKVLKSTPVVFLFMAVKGFLSVKRPKIDI